MQNFAHEMLREIYEQPEALHRTLALGKERVERERTFAGATESRDDREFPDRQIEIEILQVVVPHPAQPDGVM
jgi:hypothetical protein